MHCVQEECTEQLTVTSWDGEGHCHAREGMALLWVYHGLPDPVPLLVLHDVTWKRVLNSEYVFWGADGDPTVPGPAFPELGISGETSSRLCNQNAPASSPWCQLDSVPPLASVPSSVSQERSHIRDK